MKSLNTAIVTWITYRNFGTYLQAYALQHIIKQLGYRNSILSDSRIVESFYAQTLKAKIGRLLRKIQQNIFNYQYACQKRQEESRYNDFAKKFLKIDYLWADYDELNEKYDLFICGSDQIWSPIVPYNSYYYLAFTNKDKIAYAPSIGSWEYPDKNVEIVKPFLERFKALSIREIQGAEILKNKFGLKAQTVLDPTLLLDKKDWELLTLPVKYHKPYILCYLLTYNTEYLEFVRQYAKNVGLKLKIFITDKRYCQYADEHLFVGPQEFITEIKGASVFFTDSFHGSIFAIHFEKDFYTFKRFKDCAKNDQNSRIINLFDKLGIKERFISGNELKDISLIRPLAYNCIKAKLVKERKMSLNYLQTALDKNIW